MFFAFTHIMVICGFNVANVAGLFMAGFNHLLGRRWGTLAAILGLASG